VAWKPGFVHRACLDRLAADASERRWDICNAALEHPREFNQELRWTGGSPSDFQADSISNAGVTCGGDIRTTLVPI
jgi:hypothetical protein